MHRILLSIALSGLCALSHADASEAPGNSANSAKVDFQHDIREILKERCWACHGALKQEAGLRLDTTQLMLQGGDSGPAYTASSAHDSLIIERIRDTDPGTRMPPEGAPLTQEQIQKISDWIAQGAIPPEDEMPEEDPLRHWAFQSPVRPSLPQTRADQFTTHPVDAFLNAAMQDQQVEPRPRADRATLLRRIFLDLIGIPPTPEELQAFLADESPDAYENVVDRLLHDPRYGQRWGRHWLDVWRYSDWYGRREAPDVWNSAPQIWRWRDWVVNALNDNVRYDEMIRMMLAADEVAPGDDNSVVATGFLVRNWYALNPNDWMRSNVEHAGKAFLGLTFNCAHCHDHKYDPIMHDDYFQLRAFFETIDLRQDRWPGEGDPGLFQEYQYSTLRKIQRLGLIRVYDKNPDAKTLFYTGGDERNLVKERDPFLPTFPKFLGDLGVQVNEVTLPPRAFYPGYRHEIQDTIRQELQQQLTDARTRFEQVSQESTDATPQHDQQLAQAQSEYDQLLAETPADLMKRSMQGWQSLELDARNGRQILAHPLKQLKTLPDQISIQFKLQILQDQHVNFQLARDLEKGLTSGYIGFQQGKILAFNPGSTSTFVAASYEPAGEPKQFQIWMHIDFANNTCRFNILDEQLQTFLVEDIPMSLGDWNPVRNPEMGLFLDAQPGSHALFDALRLHAGHIDPREPATSAPLLSFDFEPPTYLSGVPFLGQEHWKRGPLSTGPNDIRIRQNSLLTSDERIKTAQKTIETLHLAGALRAKKVTEAQAAMLSAESQLKSLQNIIDADRARYESANEEEARSLARVAGEQQRLASFHQAQWKLERQELAALVAEAKPADDPDRANELQAAATPLAGLRTAVEAAQKEVDSPANPETYQPLSPVYPAKSTGRRRALAEWITSPKNPLTARVAVNHVWLRHFHTPLVSSMYDFGRNGSRPTHPELLDWLAVEFMESGWDMRHLHRLMVTSQAYQRDSKVGESRSSLQADADNRLLWRMNSNRMEAEVVRDSLLACANRLDVTPGGQELENPLSLTSYRRSLYYASHPENNGMSPLGKLFDAPDPLDCYRRSQTVVPQQALALTNSPLVHELSAAVVATAPPKKDDSGEVRFEEFINDSFVRILSRPPSENERAACLARIQQYVALLKSDEVADPELRACESLIRTLFNHNDFVTVR